MPDHRRLILFGRYPVPGRTKTRLIPALGALGAAELQRWLTEKTLATLGHASLGGIDFCFEGGSHAQVHRWLGHRHGVAHIYPQADGDLGRRMAAALDQALACGVRQVVLLGTDVPGLTADHLRRAFDALGHNDVVFGPSTDGGYWLVGCRRPAAVFADIHWGSDCVLDQTLMAARRQGLSTALLPLLRDIDTPADLAAWPVGKAFRRRYLSVVVPTLNEAAHVGRTLAQLDPAQMEAIVADGGSRDATATIARQAGATVIQAPRGRAAQQNAGARAARGRVLLFLHADTRLPDDFGGRLFECLMDRKVVLGAFHFRTDVEARAMRWIELAANLRARFLHMPYGDQAFFLPRAAFYRLGGFPAAAVAEDLFLARRAARKGRVVLSPGTVITSGRRWRALGIWRTTLINSIIAAGCLAGVRSERLAPLYRAGARRNLKK